MRRLLALLFLALPALGQVNVTTAPCKITDGSCASPASVPGGSTFAANVHTGTTFRATAPATVTITNATNATPIVVTAAAHGLVTGDNISISGITGNTNANGYFKITRLTANTFSLQNYSTGADIAGNGAYGGAPVAVAGIVQANRVLVGDGTAAAPGVAFANYPGTGLRLPSANAIQVMVNGTPGMFFNNATTVVLPPGAYFGWSPAGDPSSAGADTILGRRTAANIRQGGNDAAAPVAQTSSVQGVAAGTADTAGVARTYTGSVSTGGGAGGALVDRTTYPGAASTAQNSFSDRRYLASGWTTLTESSATAFATLTFGASSAVGADLLVTIHAADASNNQVMTYRVRVNSVRDAAGNTQSTVGIVDDSGTLPAAAGSGTLTSTFSVTEGAAAVTLNATAVSSLTQTTLRATFQAVANGAGLVVAPVGF